MRKPVLENGNVNCLGTNAQTVFDKRRNPKQVFMVVEIGKHVHNRHWQSTCCVETDSVDLKPSTRNSRFWPVKFKRCAKPTDTHEWKQQEPHIARAVVTSVCELQHHAAIHHAFAGFRTFSEHMVRLQASKHSLFCAEN